MKKRIKLVAWVKTKHDGQLIKKTIEPYYNHLIFVAETVRKATPLGFEIGLCHDLLEDTDTNEAELEKQLITFGYDLLDARFITYCVVELTDVFTKEAYPHLSKSSRKAKEADRLSMISPASQTVKYADLLYNVGWVLKYNHKKALKYLKAKKKLLALMDKGDRKLWKRVSKVIEQAIMELGKQ
jgi:(p)ppGpp synthase/HD superfamily hydrolase